MDADPERADIPPRPSELVAPQPPQPPTPGSDLRDVVRVTGQLLVVALLLGLAVGVAWLWVAPEIRLRVSGDSAYLDEVEGARVFARDGWFAILTGVAGVLTALVGWSRHRVKPVPLMLGLTIAGLVGAVVGWRCGVALGPDSIADQRAGLPAGQPLQAPLRVDAIGVFFAWPIASVATVFVLALVERGPRPRPSHRRQ